MTLKSLYSLAVWRNLNARTQRFMFNSGTSYVEMVSGVLLVVLALAASLKSDVPFHFGVKQTSTAIPLIVGLMQLIIAPILCKGQCWASRGLLAAVSSAVWVVAAASAYTAIPPEPLGFAGAAILSITMVMATINIITCGNVVGRARHLKD